MQLKKALVGGFPKSPKLGKAISWYNAGKISKDKLDKYIKESITKLFNLANDIKLDYVTNGLFRWDDIVDITFGYIRGAEKGALQRFFDNNFYYRQPIIKAKIERKEASEYINDLEFSRKIKDEMGLLSKFKAVILGPLTYYSLSDNQYYNDAIELMTDYAFAVNSLLGEISNLADAIEIHEPSIFGKNVGKQLLEKLPEVYNIMLSNIKIEKHLITYFEIENMKRLDTLFALPVDYFGIDVIENIKKLAKIYPYFSGKKVYLGLLNARNTKMERISTIHRVINSSMKRKAIDVLIGNNTILDFIPEIVAVKKLKLLKKLEEVKLNG
ncbi:MAG: hypothetical protein QXY56_01400 [Saccharolobus sp.]